MDPTQELAALARIPEDRFPLDRAWALLTAHARPELDVDAAVAGLDQLAAGCREPTLDGLIRHLFVEEGFAGNRWEYDDPRNSYLDEVLDRRTGLPISLSVLAMEVGRRVGVPVAGVGLPGHFVLRDRVDPDVFVDAFAGGTILDAEGCADLVRRIHGPEVALSPAWLEPVGPAAVIARMVANLVVSFGRRHDHANLRWALELRTRLPDATEADHRARQGIVARYN